MGRRDGGEDAECPRGVNERKVVSISLRKGGRESQYPIKSVCALCSSLKYGARDSEHDN